MDKLNLKIWLSVASISLSFTIAAVKIGGFSKVVENNTEALKDAVSVINRLEAASLKGEMKDEYQDKILENLKAQVEKNRDDVAKILN